MAGLSLMAGPGGLVSGPEKQQGGRFNACEDFLAIIGQPRNILK